MTVLARPVVAVAAAGLGLLGTSASVAEASGPVYAKPASACKLVRAATLHKYLPGSHVVLTSDRGPSIPGEQESVCGWGSGSGAVLTVQVTVFGRSAPVSAQSQYAYDVKAEERGVTAGGVRTRPVGVKIVRGLGTQATAVFEVQTGIGQPVQVIDLNLWSGNALVDVSIAYTGVAVGEAPLVPSRSGQLADAVAITADVLHALPR